MALEHGDGARKAIMRLLEAAGVDLAHVAADPIRIEPWGGAVMIRFEGFAVVSLEDLHAALRPE